MYKDNNNITISNIVPCSMNTSYWNNKPQTINKTNFADAKLVAEQIYNHLNSSDSGKDLFIKKENINCQTT